MDKQFARILMLSILLFAAANLAEAIEREIVAPPVVADSVDSGYSNYPSSKSERFISLEGRRFLKAITTENDAMIRRRGD
jgi:hypothetical protein